MKIGYITQKSFLKDGETITYLSGSMQILGIANMLEFTITESNSDNPNSPTYYIKLPRLKSNLANNIILYSIHCNSLQTCCKHNYTI